MAAPPRAFGAGPWGTGPWPVYVAQLYSVGCATTLRFGAQTKTAMAWEAHALTGIRFTVDGTAALTMQPGAASGITFDITGELFWTWIRTPPCEIGTWKLVA
jgi:hypothetical protein